MDTMSASFLFAFLNMKNADMGGFRVKWANTSRFLPKMPWMTVRSGIEAYGLQQHPPQAEPMAEFQLKAWLAGFLGRLCCAVHKEVPPLWGAFHP